MAPTRSHRTSGLPPVMGCVYMCEKIGGWGWRPLQGYLWGVIRCCHSCVEEPRPEGDPSPTLLDRHPDIPVGQERSKEQWGGGHPKSSAAAGWVACVSECVCVSVSISVPLRIFVVSGTHSLKPAS